MNASTRNTMFVLAMLVIVIVLSFVNVTPAKAWCVAGIGDTCAPVLPACGQGNPNDSTFTTPDNGLATCAAQVADKVEEVGTQVTTAINTPTAYDRCMAVKNDGWYCVWNSAGY